MPTVRAGCTQLLDAGDPFAVAARDVTGLARILHNSLLYEFRQSVFVHERARREASTPAERRVVPRILSHKEVKALVRRELGRDLLGRIVETDPNPYNSGRADLPEQTPVLFGALGCVADRVCYDAGALTKGYRALLDRWFDAGRVGTRPGLPRYEKNPCRAVAYRKKLLQVNLTTGLVTFPTGKSRAAVNLPPLRMPAYVLTALRGGMAALVEVQLRPLRSGDVLVQWTLDETGREGVAFPDAPESLAEACLAGPVGAIDVGVTNLLALTCTDLGVFVPRDPGTAVGAPLFPVLPSDVPAAGSDLDPALDPNQQVLPIWLGGPGPDAPPTQTPTTHTPNAVSTPNPAPPPARLDALPTPRALPGPLLVRGGALEEECHRAGVRSAWLRSRLPFLRGGTKGSASTTTSTTTTPTISTTTPTPTPKEGDTSRTRPPGLSKKPTIPRRKKGPKPTSHRRQQRSSHALREAWALHNRRTSHLVHASVQPILARLEETGARALVVGWNEGIKERLNMGRVQNARFGTIPYEAIRSALQAGCARLGILYLEVNEAYTSKTSFLDGELPRARASYAGVRVRRGLFRTGSGLLVNADVNASLQILVRALVQEGCTRELAQLTPERRGEIGSANLNPVSARPDLGGRDGGAGAGGSAGGSTPRTLVPV